MDRASARSFQGKIFAVSSARAPTLPSLRNVPVAISSVAQRGPKGCGTTAQGETDLCPELPGIEAQMEKLFDKILCTVDFDASSTAVTAENSNPHILMVQPAQDWQRRNVADPLRVPKVGVDLLARKKGPTGRYRVRIPSSLRHPVLDIRHSSRGALSFHPREFNERRLPPPYFQISSSVPTASNWLHEPNCPPSISLEWSRDTEDWVSERGRDSN